MGQAERVRAQAHLAVTVEGIKQEYERVLAAEAARAKEHYLKELQEHLQIQQKVHALTDYICTTRVLLFVLCCISFAGFFFIRLNAKIRFECSC
jgi:hypothetical protein